MPQMMPLMWILSLVSMIMILMATSSIMYFFLPAYTPTRSYTIKKLKWKWKW